MMPPNAMSVAQVSRDTGVSDVTLYNWRNKFRHEGKSVPADPSNPENWSGDNKLAVVIETAALNEEERAEYCRQKGLYVEQIVRWREAAAAGAETQRPLSATERRELQQERKKSRKLAKELRRKDKALADSHAAVTKARQASTVAEKAKGLSVYRDGIFHPTFIPLLEFSALLARLS